MDLKGTKTEQNVKAALMGESVARNKYTYYADQARKEGNQEIAALFDRMAGNESVHAKIWFTTLNGAIKGNLENLKDAAAGEFGEWSDMYPQFAAVAREEGFEQLAVMFEKVAEIEKNHEKQFMEAMVRLMKSGKEASAAGQKEQSVKPAQPVKKKHGYRCMFCGAIYEDRLDVCPVCQAIGSFEDCEILA